MGGGLLKMIQLVHSWTKGIVRCGEERELSAYLLLFPHMIPVLSLCSVVHRGYRKGSVGRWPDSVGWGRRQSKWQAQAIVFVALSL